MTSSLRIALGSIAIAAFLTAVAAAAWMHSGGRDADWQRVRARGAAMTAHAAHGERPHAPLRGEPVAGEATAQYVRATAEHDRAQRVLHEQRRQRDVPDLFDLIEARELPPDTAQRLAPFEAAIASLAAGAASDRIHFAAFWMQFEYDAAGEPLARPCDFVGFPVGKIALVAARHELARGRCELALQRTADALTLARDQLQVGIPLYELIGTDTVGACCAVWPDGALRSLAPPLLRDLAEVLRRFDDATAPAVQSVRDACGMLAEGAFHDPGRSDWRQLATRAFRDPANRSALPAEIDAYFDAIDALPPATAPWSVREPALVAAAALLPQLGGLGLADVERARREAIARVRLLRMAIVHHLGEPVPPLPDPFGDGALHRNDDGDGARFSSRGQADGKAIERRVPKQ